MTKINDWRQIFRGRRCKAQLLIGLQTSQDLELISINNNVSAVIAKETEILDKYQDVFAGHGLVDGKFHIGLRDDAKPTIHLPRKNFPEPYAETPEFSL